jgi:hypothetical protein
VELAMNIAKKVLMHDGVSWLSAHYTVYPNRAVVIGENGFACILEEDFLHLRPHELQPNKMLASAIGLIPFTLKVQDGQILPDLLISIFDRILRYKTSSCLTAIVGQKKLFPKGHPYRNIINYDLSELSLFHFYKGPIPVLAAFAQPDFTGVYVGHGKEHDLAITNPDCIVKVQVEFTI